MRNGQQTGPFTEEEVRRMVGEGTTSEADPAWYKGLAEWQPLHRILNFAPLAPTPSPLVKPPVRRGVLIAGWICLALGFACMIYSMWLFFIYVPLYVAAFILGVVGMFQRRLLGGLGLIMATVVLSMGVGLILGIYRASDALDGVQKSYLKFKKDTEQDRLAANEQFERQSLDSLRTRKIQFGIKLKELAQFKILESKFGKSNDLATLGKPYVDVTVENAMTVPIRKVYFRGVYATPGRTIPWLDATFTKEVSGGLEVGEKATWRLEPDEPVDPADLELHDDAVFEFSVISLDGPEGTQIVSDATFTKKDEKDLQDLEEKYGDPAPVEGEEK